MTEEEYQAALKRMDEIFDAEPGTPEGDELDRLAEIVDDHERATFIIQTQS